MHKRSWQEKEREREKRTDFELALVVNRELDWNHRVDCINTEPNTGVACALSDAVDEFEIENLPAREKPQADCKLCARLDEMACTHTRDNPQACSTNGKAAGWGSH